MQVAIANNLATAANTMLQLGVVAAQRQMTVLTRGIASKAEKTYSYQYLPPGSSLREPAYGVSISDPDVYHYYQSPSYVSVGNPARLPFSQQGNNNQKAMYKFPGTTGKTNKFHISLSDPVYKTENDAKD